MLLPERALRQARGSVWSEGPVGPGSGAAMQELLDGSFTGRRRTRISDGGRLPFRGSNGSRGADCGGSCSQTAFTREARGEATRDGAPPIDLIDGEQLCELLKQHQLGVRTTERRVEDVEVLGSFFQELG